MTIVIIEDFKLISEMLAVTCERLLPGSSVSCAYTAQEGMELCRKLVPELVLLDVVLPDRDGIELVPKIFEISRSAKVIALTSHTDEFTLHRAMAARLHGFVDKNEAPLKGLSDAIECVMKGRLYLSPAAARLKASLSSDPVAFSKLLSPHEQRLLGLFGVGLSNEAVADQTGLSAATIKVHRRNIMAKLNIHSTPELIHYALEKGFARLKRDAAAPREVAS